MPPWSPRELDDWPLRQEQSGIDQLVTEAGQAMRAYRICKDRLDQFKDTLNSILRGDNPNPGADRHEAEVDEQRAGAGTPRRVGPRTDRRFDEAGDDSGDGPGPDRTMEAGRTGSSPRIARPKKIGR